MPCCRKSVRFDNLLKNAKKGGPAEKFQLGIEYLSLGATELALPYIKKASDGGYPDAHYVLGAMYQNGVGVKKNDREARRLYAKAAEMGNYKAYCELIVMNSAGTAGDMAVRLASDAADGDTDAQYTLGLFYAEGVGVQKNIDRARELISGAAMEGNDEAVKYISVARSEGI
jgi:FOG: TPR repeat, SEL1 subfamily